MGVNHLEYKIVKASRGESIMKTDLVVLYMLDGEMSVRCYGGSDPNEKGGCSAH